MNDEADEPNPGQCIECYEKPRYRLDLLCEDCRAKSYGNRAGLTVAPCRCNCGYTCDRLTCPLDLFECIRLHWKQDCDHDWTGEPRDLPDDRGFSSTCSKCGIMSLDHDCAVGP